MDMNSRTLIKKVIEFDNAEMDRLQFRTGGILTIFLYADIERRKDFDYKWHKPEDFLPDYPELKTFDGYVRKDEFGNVMGQNAHRPVNSG